LKEYLLLKVLYLSEQEQKVTPNSIIYRNKRCIKLLIVKSREKRQVKFICRINLNGRPSGNFTAHKNKIFLKTSA
jgi:hypothetical protein